MFVTFYSYKGGVGRSLALANIACLLAEDPEHAQRVLVWDFDLEAPGLHRLFPPSQPYKLGFVDLAHSYARTGTIPEIQDYIYASEVANVDVLPAGRVDLSYCASLQALHWPAFFTANPADPGPFFGGLKTALQKIEPRYDYILIDSRTGLNDQAGICTEVLPDLLVILFRLSAQNLDGLQHVVPMVKFQLESRKRPNVQILPVASVVSPTSSPTTLAAREAAEKLFGEKLRGYISFDAELITDEKLLSLKNNRRAMWPVPPIVGDYVNLARAIRDRNPNDTKTRTAEINAKMRAGDFVAAWDLLRPTLLRKPTNVDLWRMFWMLSQAGPLKREESDELVEQMLKSGQPSAYCFDWKAMRLVADAESPDSQKLDEAVGILFEALRISSAAHRLRLIPYLAKTQSCRGDLQSAIQTLRDSQAESRDSQLDPKTNAQIGLDLSMLQIRLGAKYFSSAIDTIEAMQSENEEKYIRLAYLYAFLKETDKAERAFGEFRERDTRRWAALCEAHLLLLFGEKDAAFKVAGPSAAKASGATEKGNWAEFFICAGEFDRCIEFVGTQKKKKGGDPALAAVEKLARYLKGSSNLAQDEVRAEWSGAENWGFKELVFFRERVKEAPEEELSDRLAIVELLIRDQEFKLLKQRHVVAAPRDVGRRLRRGIELRGRPIR